MTHSLDRDTRVQLEAFLDSTFLLSCTSMRTALSSTASLLCGSTGSRNCVVIAPTQKIVENLAKTDPDHKSASIVRFERISGVNIGRRRPGRRRRVSGGGAAAIDGTD